MASKGADTYGLHIYAARVTNIRSSAQTRGGSWTLVLVLILAMRLIAPAGFMPDGSESRFAISICHAGGASAPVATLHIAPTDQKGHDTPRKGAAADHQPCGYAAAASLGLIGGDPPTFVPATARAAAFIPVGRWTAPLRQRLRERPPLRGPPRVLPA